MRMHSNTASRRARKGVAVLVALPLLASGCSVPDLSLTSGPAVGFAGGVTADEPQAAAVARDVLAKGGSAVDATVAGLFALSVTLPSRAGLGGGGACVVYAPGEYTPNKGVAEAILFLPQAPAHTGPLRTDGAILPVDRPAAVPMLARGLFALHAKYGTTKFNSLIEPAQAMARDGVIVPRALLRDLAVVAGPLSADPVASVTYFVGGRPLAEGAKLQQPGLAATLAEIITLGVGGFYTGFLGQRIAAGARDAGGGLTLEDLRVALPKFAPAVQVTSGEDSVAFLPPPADGGLAAAAAFTSLQAKPADTEAANARGLAVAARWRLAGGDARTLLAQSGLPAANLPALPASASFAVVDKAGMAVSCAVTMNNLFGTGRIAAGTGIVLAASPVWQRPPLLSAAIAYNPKRRAFHAAVASSGQAGAPLATAVAMRQALAGQPAAPVPDPGRANALVCKGYLPGSGRGCVWSTDPRGAGAALGEIP